MRLRTASLKTQPAAAVRALAVFCALSVWVLGLLAISPQLHESLHHDAGNADHSCAVTLFGHGVEQTVSAAGLASAPVFYQVGVCPVQPALPVAETPHRLPPACGPPQG